MSDTEDRQALIRRLDQVSICKMQSKESIDFLFQKAYNPTSIDTVAVMLDSILETFQDLARLCGLNEAYTENPMSYPGSEYQVILREMNRKYRPETS